MSSATRAIADYFSVSLPSRTYINTEIGKLGLNWPQRLYEVRHQDIMETVILIRGEICFFPLHVYKAGTRIDRPTRQNSHLSTRFPFKIN